jgi:hypothetical protein
MVVVGGYLYPQPIFYLLADCSIDRHTGQSGGAPDTAMFIVQCVPRQLTVGVWSG